ncbi:PKD domain-containing protein, partial [Neptunitalea chrysea]|uniref:PKD domain-containing protein n=1 Tax=Neptunitalea chrysea TaxID=1647581 RepID=UPI0035A231A4
MEHKYPYFRNKITFLKTLSFVFLIAFYSQLAFGNNSTPLRTPYEINKDVCNLTTTGTQQNSCTGMNNGTATVTVTGGTAPYTYSWSYGVSITDTAENLAPGTYIVTITDNASCTINHTFVITETDITPPEGLICKDITLELDANGQASITPTDVSEASLYYIDQTGAFNPIDISSGATDLSIGDDQIISNLPIGFDFDFFGVSYSSFNISSNGFMSFDVISNSGCCSGQFLPTPGFGSLIAFSWEDIDPGNGGQPVENVVRYKTVGTAPNRVLVMEFYNVDHWSNGNNITTQVQLHEGSNVVEIHTTVMPSDGGNHTQGIQNSDASIAYPVPGRNSQNWSISNDYVAFIPTLLDACDGTNVTLSTDITSFDCTNLGANSVVVSASDTSGNTDTCTATVTIIDAIAPTPDNTTLADYSSQCVVEESDITVPTATDNCGALTATHNTTFPISTLGTTVITWTYTDASGNTATQNQNIIISQDTTAPVADSATLVDITAQCLVVETDVMVPTATDNCAGTVTVTHNATFPITAQGTTVITWTYTDTEGNFSTQTQNVIITDTTAPVADNPTLAAITDQCIVTETDVPVPTATDNCGGTVTTTHDVTFPITMQGTTIITWTYTDENGNSATQNQNVVIADTTAPVPDNTTLADITDQCMVAETAITIPTASDNCSGTVTTTHNVTFPITAQGTTVITWTYTDENGNASTQNQNVIIDDTTAPVPDS